MGAVAAIGLALSAVSTIQQMEASDEAAEAAGQQADLAKKAEEARARQSEMEAQRERIKQAREARIRRAQVVSSTGNEGLGFGGTSGNVGAVSSLDSQFASNIGYINQREGFANEISGYNIASADAGSDLFSAQANAQRWQQIGNLGDSIFQAKGGWTTIFGGNTHKDAGK